MAKRKRQNEASEAAKSQNSLSTTKSAKATTNGVIASKQGNGSDILVNSKANTTSNAPKAASKSAPSKIAKTSQHVDVHSVKPVIQIVTGSYERILHGITAHLDLSIDENDDVVSTDSSAKFSDTFLFNAHASAIRCLALSALPKPTDAAQDVYLATGGSDERVNVYSLAASSLPETDRKGRQLPVMPTLGPNQVNENPMNRELGTLTQHSANITAVHFPSRSKLLSASEDNSISITRVRDLAEVSSVKAPRPKLSGQASGDSAIAGTVPAGVNDFAVHPSMKLMISVGRGERCMRLWNLVKGQKAGVLNFDKEVLQVIKESKFSHGEGRKIQYNSDGSEFAISFERGIVIFGEDARVKCVALPQPLTKIHHIAYLPLPGSREVLAVSTESGHIVFYDTAETTTITNSINPKSNYQQATAIAILGGKVASVNTRVKDFSILDLAQVGTAPSELAEVSSNIGQHLLVVAAHSDGAIRLWTLLKSDLRSKDDAKDESVRRVGSQVGSYKTGNRITCMSAFVMLPAEELDGGLSDFESGAEMSEGDDDSD